MLRFIYVANTASDKHTAISIHPMLRFISIFHCVRQFIRIFQYIPCYGLSTSAFKQVQAGASFQYIPCYGLSTSFVSQKIFLVRFQYIPCYGLSDSCTGSGAVSGISIHPMLRFIRHFTMYPLILNQISIHPMLRFIRFRCSVACWDHCISIHPMLRFIR